MKNKTRTQPTLSTQTFTSNPKNLCPKTAHNQADKKRTKMKFSKKIVPPYNLSPRLAKPQKAKRTKKRKTAFFGTFLEGAILCDKEQFYAIRSNFMRFITLS